MPRGLSGITRYTMSRCSALWVLSGFLHRQSRFEIMEHGLRNQLGVGWGAYRSEESMQTRRHMSPLLQSFLGREPGLRGKSLEECMGSLAPGREDGQRGAVCSVSVLPGH